jgi:hypothetical protein
VSNSRTAVLRTFEVPLVIICGRNTRENGQLWNEMYFRSPVDLDHLISATFASFNSLEGFLLRKFSDAGSGNDTNCGTIYRSPNWSLAFDYCVMNETTAIFRSLAHTIAFQCFFSIVSDLNHQFHARLTLFIIGILYMDQILG